jgi:hypothetical protein
MSAGESPDGVLAEGRILADLDERRDGVPPGGAAGRIEAPRRAHATVISVASVAVEMYLDCSGRDLEPGPVIDVPAA